VSKVAVLIFCGALALLLLNGCATSNETPPPDWSATNEVSSTEASPKGVRVPLPLLLQTNLPPIPRTNVATTVAKTNGVAIRTNLPVVLVTNVPTATNFLLKPHAPPVNTYTSLKRWALDEKLAPPRLLAKSPLATYAISCERGVMVLAIGSREAIWNGVALHLGFPPEFIDGEVYIHGLDLQKTLAPFLCDHPLVFGTNRTVVIDAGHGGINAGTISVTDRRPEKEFTLDWARRLQPLLEKEGWQVCLTRTNDSDIALSNRVTFAENRHADLFISLHFNSLAPDPKPVGLATFCLTPMGMPSTVTRGFPDLLFQSYPNNNFDTENEQIAERVQRALLHATNMEDRGINRARFIGVLRGQHRPAILIEAGFLSNPHEAKRIEDPEFRQKLAEALAEALK
jgi:N-acetylmuramoyl-L-alanine amidase